MNNPYQILGINERASDDEIKKAYRDLVKKYHPDQYRDNPLSELAQEKLKEINEAYDTLMKNKAGAYDTSSSNRRYSSQHEERSSYTGPDSIELQRVRVFINANHIVEAEQLLNQMNNHSAEWNYLRAIIFMRKGWYSEAQSSIQMAIQMDPTNQEYQRTLNQMSNVNQNYAGNVYQRGTSNGPDLCSTCQCLICSNCCCESLGGGLIPCC